jgi:HrpA-like RNA helicase
MECLSVGVRRFPIEIMYAEDIAASTSGFSSTIMNLAKDTLNATKNSSKDGVLPKVVKSQFNLAFAIIKSIGRVGSGILVFVSGIADITDLTEKFEGMEKYKVIAIHSDIPFEEQEAAFRPAEPNEVKVVIATNAGNYTYRKY